MCARPKHTRASAPRRSGSGCEAGYTRRGLATQEGKIVGIRFGKYVLLDRVAVGGMAEIFLARQEGLEGFEKTIVIKRIRPHLSNQKAFVTMFLNEAKLAAQLNHPNIVQIYDLGKIGPSYFIAMECIVGRDMRRIIPKAQAMGVEFPMIYALKIASSVCEGLYYAHQRVDLRGEPLRIVHRDVTPENIFVSFDGTVKILDFGIAKAANQIEQTRAGEIKGKLSYMSPEQCMGKSLDQRSDLFSLGAVLYEWITGVKLFTGDSDVSILKAITDRTITPPSQLRAEVPEAVERILMKALERDRERRYQTAWEMQSDIERYLAKVESPPSNIHLANFLRQLFKDELDEERQRLLAQGATQSPPRLEVLPGGEGASRSSADDDPMAPIPLRPRDRLRDPNAGDDTLPNRRTRELTVELAESDYEALERLADRNEVPLGTLVADLLQAYLKYR
jgi:eukaryotic-like serine/threonine-protein kinase